MGFPPKFAESLVYQFFKKYQDEHEKKFPPKGAALAKRWEEFNKKEAAPKTEEVKEEPKVQEIKTDVE